MASYLFKFTVNLPFCSIYVTQDMIFITCQSACKINILEKSHLLTIFVNKCIFSLFQNFITNILSVSANSEFVNVLCFDANK